MDNFSKWHNLFSHHIAHQRNNLLVLLFVEKITRYQISTFSFRSFEDRGYTPRIQLVNRSEIVNTAIGAETKEAWIESRSLRGPTQTRSSCSKI